MSANSTRGPGTMYPWTTDEEAEHAKRERVEMIARLVVVDGEHDQYWAFGHYRSDDFHAACALAGEEAGFGFNEEDLMPEFMVERKMVTLKKDGPEPEWRTDKDGILPVTRLQW